MTCLLDEPWQRVQTTDNLQPSPPFYSWHGDRNGKWSRGTRFESTSTSRLPLVCIFAVSPRPLGGSWRLLTWQASCTCTATYEGSRVANYPIQSAVQWSYSDIYLLTEELTFSIKKKVYFGASVCVFMWVYICECAHVYMRVCFFLSFSDSGTSRDQYSFVTWSIFLCIMYVNLQSNVNQFQSCGIWC